MDLLIGFIAGIVVTVTIIALGCKAYSMGYDDGKGAE
jgi:hypothetical protein